MAEPSKSPQNNEKKIFTLTYNRGGNCISCLYVCLHRSSLLNNGYTYIPRKVASSHTNFQMSKASAS